MTDPQYDPQYVFHQITYEAITPVHVGSGQDVGVVDLPVIRERTTDYPYLPGSGIRGALRDRCERKDRDLVRRLFGAEGGEEISAGCVVVLDAHLVLFPVRTIPGVFRWVTAPFVLRRWRSLREYFLGHAGRVPVPQKDPADGFFAGSALDGMLLEEYPFRKDADNGWKWPSGLLKVEAGQVLLLSDADFLHFVRHATQVRQRNRLSTAKTVLNGQLFSVEAVPAEARFVGFLGATDERREEPVPGGEADQAGDRKPALKAAAAAAELQRLATTPKHPTVGHLTLGGDESVGMGMTRMTWEPPKQQEIEDETVSADKAVVV